MLYDTQSVLRLRSVRAKSALSSRSNPICSGFTGLTQPRLATLKMRILFESVAEPFYAVEKYDLYELTAILIPDLYKCTTYCAAKYFWLSSIARLLSMSQLDTLNNFLEAASCFYAMNRHV